jgi:hypothetical protein
LQNATVDDYMLQMRQAIRAANNATFMAVNGLSEVRNIFGCRLQCGAANCEGG